MYKGNLNNTAFNKVRVAQSVEHRTSEFRAAGSNPSMGKAFLFCILSFSTRTWQVDWFHTNETKHDVHARYIVA